jgi:hypothetical protein
MTGLLVAIIVGGIWLILSAVILVSVCISSSRFNQEECSVLHSETFVKRKNTSNRREKLTLKPGAQVVGH